MSVANHTPDRVAYRQSEISRMLGISLPTWHRMRRAGLAPAPDIIYGRTRLWAKDTIDSWLANQPKATPASNAS
jgi:predicted DNA-binding transcriptional regulator AlpA